MLPTCIIVADAARARFLRLEIHEEPDLEGGPDLTEHRDFVNPDADVPERELFSDRSGLGRSGRGASTGSVHRLDDHRDQHAGELERRFAKRILEAAASFVAEQGARQLIVVAGPRMLGKLRAAAAAEGGWGAVEVKEVGEDLSRRSLMEIREALSARGLVPAAQIPRAAVYQPRGQHIPRSS